MNKNKILTELPKKGNRIDWKSTVGMEVELIYKDKIYIVKIVGYKSPTLEIEYNKIIKSIKCNNFTHMKVGELLKLNTKDFKFEIGEQIGGKIITYREYRQRKHLDGTSIINYKWYKYKCNVCGWDEGWIVEGDLLKGNSCSCCTSKVVVEDINSIWATDRWMCDLGLSEKDAKTHTRGSNKKVIVTCPHCKKEKEITISKLFQRKSIGCVCGDGVSYPEKFMMSVLNQLNIEYIRQYKPDYLKRDGEGQKKSDFYLLQHKLIIETDGILGHENGVAFDGMEESLQKSIEIDKWKEKQHLKHGLKTIRVNCFESNMEYIRDNVLDSELNELFDLSKVNWAECNKEAQKNYVKVVCELWNNKKEGETPKDIERKINKRISVSTIISYLHIGTELGWCKYIGSKREVAIFKNDKPYILEGRESNVFTSASELARLSREDINMFGTVFSQGDISSVCRGERKSHKGYTFKYMEGIA